MDCGSRKTADSSAITTDVKNNIPANARTILVICIFGVPLMRGECGHCSPLVTYIDAYSAGMD
jgi:hypothetical protein